jgi:uncharacterized protein YndB with AHSA1/START domain
LRRRPAPFLVAPSAIRAWWTATSAIVVPEKGGLWAAAWGPEDDPDYVTTATIAVFDRPKRLVLSDYAYKSKTGPLPFEPKFKTTFDVRPNGRGAVLEVHQAGFPGGSNADAFYKACEAGWAATLKQFAAFVERA